MNLQKRRTSRTGNQRERKWQAELSPLLLGLFFYPEDGGDMFLRKAD
jgi:hypothetical protein